jgi:hypothetical protein
MTCDELLSAIGGADELDEARRAEVQEHISSCPECARYKDHEKAEEAVDALPFDERSTFLLHFVHGLTLAEVAESLELPPGIVARQIRTAVEWLGKAAPELGIAFERPPELDAMGVKPPTLETMSCEELLTVLADHRGVLGDAHAARCAECAQLRRDYPAALAVARALPKEMPNPPGMRERVGMIAEAVGEQMAAPRRRRRRQGLLVAAATVMAALIGEGGYVLGTRAAIDPTLEVARARMLHRSEEELARAERTQDKEAAAHVIADLQDLTVLSGNEPIGREARLGVSRGYLILGDQDHAYAEARAVLLDRHSSALQRERAKAILEGK